MIERLRDRVPAGAAGEFSTPETTLCADSFSVSFPPPVLPQWHVKDPGHSAKSAGGRLHLNMHKLLDPTKPEWVDYAAVQALCGNLSGKRSHTQLVIEHSATLVSAS